MLLKLFETLFYDLGEYIFDVKPGGTHLLGDEAGGGHTRGGVNLQQVELVALGDDIVYADNTMATQDVV